jgi:hypothetical protein
LPVEKGATTVLEVQEDKCVDCINRVEFYCVEQNKEVSPLGTCEKFKDRTYADYLCELMCQEVEDD